MRNESGYYSELKLDDRFPKSLPDAYDEESCYPELELEHRRDDILFRIIVEIALTLAACVAGGVLFFLHFFR